ncbi:MAG TPA: amylo-alpha-1,6-glucosidase [Tepidisphaeraceae bacterium]
MAMFAIETERQLEPPIHQEWLLTNGLGGSAFGTVVGCNTRRYHGVLVAATLPPVGRVVTVSRVAEVLCLDNKPDMIELSVNQFRDMFHPKGDRYLTRFELDDFARWTYDAEGVRVTKELQLLWMRNVALLRYTIDAGASRPFRFAVHPFVTLKDFHHERHRAGSNMISKPGEREVTVAEGANSVTLAADAGRFEPAPDWWYNHIHYIESERGMDDSEDEFTPGRFTIEGKGQATLTIWIALESTAKPDWDAELERRRKAVSAARTDPENLTSGPTQLSKKQSPTLLKLERAANDFVVYRRSPDGKDGTSVIAGYPWFADWGRDTMISLPGLFLTTGRFHQARQVLGVFAKYVSEGMIPNRFDDYSNEPHYNTVDASLWFIHASFEYLNKSKDQKTFDAVLRPACRSIIDGYRRGTRYHIGMDETDGLICQGDATTQLTWMDAKYQNVVFTPRQGKAVEINALWYHSLVLMGEKDLAAKVRESFRREFWINPFRGLYDVVDGSRRDAAVRPNQILAVSLPNSPLSDEQQSAVVEVVRRELHTPVGLRTLSMASPHYRGRYSGLLYERDAAYHNGCVWPWLIGPFLDAYLRVNKRSPQAQEQARHWLQPLIARMDEFCIGQIHEICEGEPPHRPVGCPAQAWSVAEVLRLAVELGM